MEERLRRRPIDRRSSEVKLSPRKKLTSLVSDHYEALSWVALGGYSIGRLSDGDPIPTLMTGMGAAYRVLGEIWLKPDSSRS